MTTTTLERPATLTVDDVAERYRTSRDSVYRWLRSERSDFPRPIPLPSRGIRWTARQLDDWDRRKIAEANGA